MLKQILQHILILLLLFDIFSCEIIINSDTLTIIQNSQIIILGVAQQETFICHNKLTWKYEIAQFYLTTNLQRNIFTNPVDKIIFVGSRSVRITSNDDLEIKSTINLNGKSLDLLDGSQNIGGYALRKRSCCVVGAGPGRSFLNHGGGHGGKGGGYMKDWSTGEIYGGSYGSWIHLVGGSTGATVYNSDPGSGGGALELIVKGKLTIDASLTANGFSPGNSNTSFCSGGSAGGRVIIKANEFIIKDLIEARGASGGKKIADGEFCGDGGGGGVILINAGIITLHSKPDVDGGKGLAIGEKGLLEIGAFFETGVIQIDTTLCSLFYTQLNYSIQGKLASYFESGQDSKSWEASVCVMNFSYNVTFGIGSKVEFKGAYPLEIRSGYGDIIIETDFLLDGQPITEPDAMTHLGGFDNLHKNTKGGPGSYLNYATHSCSENPKSYGILTRSYLGGSSCINAKRGVSVGGGSIWLKATNGKIILASRISTNAYSNSSHGCGSSGGTIDLLAKEIIFNEKALLLAKGSAGFHGGDGGVIHLSSQMPIQQDHMEYIFANGGVGQEISGCQGEVRAHDIWRPIEPLFTETTEKITTTESTTNIRPTADFTLSPPVNETLIEKFKRINRSSSPLEVLQQLEGLTTNESLTSVEIVESLTILTDILNSAPSSKHQDKFESKKLVTQVMKTASTIITASVKSNHTKNKTRFEKKDLPLSGHPQDNILPYLAERLDQFGQKILKYLPKNESIAVETENIAIEMHPIDLKNFYGCYFPGCKTSELIGEIKLSENTIFLPGDIFGNATRDSFIGVTFVHVKGIEKDATWLANDGKLVHVVSDLLTISTSSNFTRGFSRPIIITHNITVNAKIDEEFSLGYWEEKSGEMWNGTWASNGCVSKRVQGMVQSKCFHMTTFAILMQVADFEVLEEHRTAMSVISYIGSSISLIGLLMTFGTFMSIRTLLSERNIIHCHLVVALGLAQIIFMAGIEATSDRMLCKVIAVSLHYLFTASFAWMLAEGIHLYIKVVSVFSQLRKMRLYYALGWGLPAIVVALSFATRQEGYGNKNVCWISIEYGLIWAFVAPVLIIICCNTIVIAIVVRILVRSVGATESITKTRSQVRYGTKAMLTLLPLLGLTWIIGIAAVNQESITLQYIFCVLNSLQGMFIFLFHCVGNTEVRIACKRYHEKHTISRSIGEKGSTKRKMKDPRSLSFKRQTYAMKDGSSSPGYDEDVILQSRRAILELINRHDERTTDSSCGGTSQARSSVYAMPSNQ